LAAAAAAAGRHEGAQHAQPAGAATAARRRLCMAKSPQIIYPKEITMNRTHRLASGLLLLAVLCSAAALASARRLSSKEGR